MSENTSPNRTGGGSRLDRDRPVTFTFNGGEFGGFEGDTVASALLAAGIRQIGSSVMLGRPRGIMASGVEDAVGLIQVEQPFPEPMMLAATTELYDGLVGTGLSGQGRLSTEGDAARNDARYAHCDVLVVGAGPAGRQAAADAVKDGGNVILLDDHPPRPGEDAPQGVTYLPRTTAFGLYDDGFVLAVERRTAHLGFAAPTHVSRERVWRIRARRIVLATGLHERHIAFTNNDLPGIMLASAAGEFLADHGVLAGREVVVFTTNDSAYPVAGALHDAGAHIAAFVDSRQDPPTDLVTSLRDRGIEVATGSVVTSAVGETAVQAVRIAPVQGQEVGERREVACDAVLVSGGWNPVLHLYSHGRGTLRYDEQRGCFLAADDLPGVDIVGSAAGDIPAGEPLWAVPDPDATGEDRRFVDLQRDATVGEVARATGAGLRSVEHVKRYTTIGTAHDQGKTSGLMTTGIMSGLLGVDISALGTTTFRPPFTQVAFGTLAARHRGVMLEPERVTSTHEWAVDHGALFENVGQWKRAWYFPKDGESMAQAVARECIAARGGVAMMDGSTLGKIDVRGSDAGVFLDHMYTNMMSTLKVGRIRYGVMCGPDGMVIDDGTVMRITEDQFVATTTTGNAAKMLEWMEEFHQTEWPHLDVWFTSVTEHWATFPLVGPRSRNVLATVVDIDVSNDAFGFMTWQDAHIDGIDVRIGRVSFSGELAYEIHVPWAYGRHIWDTVWAAGQPFGITAYGTETMHVLRAEKGYPIVGQDTDGTITPVDLGMDWVVSKKKKDFIGKRSMARPSAHDPNRKHLVGLLPLDPGTALPEGAQIVEMAELPEPPVPMLGHVTSAYRSEALDSHFALALVKGGRDRMDSTVYVTAEDPDAPLIAAKVTSTVLFDPEGTRRDG